MKLDLNSTFTSSYRWLSVSFLGIIFTIAISYGGLVLFYFMSNSWAAPVVLNPSQDRVLSFQPQVANLEASLDKQKVEFETAIATKKILDEQISQLVSLITKVDTSLEAEAKQLALISGSAAALAKAKRADIGRSNVALTEARKLLKQVDDELAAKLITSDQAATRKIALQQAINSVTDSRVTMLQLEVQANTSALASETLGGGSSSITAMGAVKQAIELKAMLAQLQIQEVTATSSAAALKRAIENAERVLAVAKTSPYYRALREEVTVAFVPYDNLEHIEVGDKVYDCYLQVFVCRKVGKVVTVYDAEEHTKHPLFKTDLRGKLIEIKFTDPDSSKSQVVFVGGKPLLL